VKAESPLEPGVPPWVPRGSGDRAEALLNISLIRCKDLLAADYGASSDPYCRITVDDKQLAKSAIKYKTLNPEYYELFHIPIKGKKFPPEKIRLSFWDHNTGFWDSDDPLGDVEVDAVPVPLSHGEQPVEANRAAMIQVTRPLHEMILVAVKLKSEYNV
jgi:hypothetical protein